MNDLTTKLAEYCYQRLKADNLPINTWRNYDALDVPISDYPVICVYRVSSTFGTRQEYDNITIAITYSISYPLLSQLPTTLELVADKLNKSIVEYELECNSYFQTSPIRADYGLRKNDLLNAIYPFLQMTLTIK